MKTFPILASNAGLIKFSKKSLKGQVCLSPFVSIEVDVNGEVSLCSCNAWMPSKVGNLFDTSLQDMLSNQFSTEIRRSIIDGTYEYCNENTCGVLNQNQLNQGSNIPERVQQLLTDSALFQMPYEIRLAGDVTCNLSCPSCRTHVIKPTANELDQRRQLGAVLSKNLFSVPSTQRIRVHTSTSGELFASPLLLEFVRSMPVDDFPGLELCIQTNGLLAQRNWHQLGKMADRVTMITVTTDAARANTYEQLRRGGRWKDLQRSLDWISNKKSQTGMELSMRMVVQQANYQEIAEFYDMSMSLNADVIEYSRILNWGTFTPSEFNQTDVFAPTHSEYAQAQAILDQVKVLPKSFLCGGLS